MRSGNGALLWRWMALIFFKLHLKHRELWWHLDRRGRNTKMSEKYDWVQLHHIHCVLRTFYTGAIIDTKVYGSLLVWPADTGGLATISTSQTFFMKRQCLSESEVFSCLPSWTTRALRSTRCKSLCTK